MHHQSHLIWMFLQKGTRFATATSTSSFPHFKWASEIGISSRGCCISEDNGRLKCEHSRYNVHSQEIVLLHCFLFLTETFKYNAFLWRQWMELIVFLAGGWVFFWNGSMFCHFTVYVFFFAPRVPSLLCTLRLMWLFFSLFLSHRCLFHLGAKRQSRRWEGVSGGKRGSSGKITFTDDNTPESHFHFYMRLYELCSM